MMQALKVLDLSGTSSMGTLPEIFGELPPLRTSLQTLDLSYCSSLHLLPESLGHLSALQTLKLNRCSAHGV